MLQQLQDDSRVLRNLPRAPLGRDLAPRVMRAISDRRLSVARRAALTERPPFPAWAGLAAAAAVLLAVFCGSYLYFYAAHNGHPPSLGSFIAHKTAPTDNPQPPVKPPEVPSTVIADNNVGPSDVVAPEKVDPEKKQPEPDRVTVEKNPPNTDTTPVAPKKDPNETAVGRTIPRLEVFDEVKTKVVFNIALKELDQEKNQKRLREELEKDNAYRFEMVFKNPKAFERLEAGFKAHGIRLLIDQLAQARMKSRQKTNYVLFVEDVTPEEVAKILETVGAQDKAEAQFGQVFIQSLTEADHKEVANLLGIDATKLGPTPKGPAGVDLRKPLSETTAQEVTNTLTGKGTPRPEAGKAPLTRQAIVLSYNPVRPPKTSKEIQQFLGSRAPRREGTVQVLLVLRGNNG
jgi:hypothetical protein